MRDVNLDVLQRAIRASICPICSQRPQGTEAWAPEVPRSCQSMCTIFANLPALKDIADHAEPVPGSYERSARRLICQVCRRNPAPPDDCSDHLLRTCPMSRHLHRIVQVLQFIDHRYIS